MLRKFIQWVMDYYIYITTIIMFGSITLACIPLAFPAKQSKPEYKQDIITIEKHKYIVLYTEKSSHLIHSESCDCFKKEIYFYEDYVKRINEAWRQVR